MQLSDQKAGIVYINDEHKQWQQFSHVRGCIGGGSSYTATEPIEVLHNDTVVPGASVYLFAHTVTHEGAGCMWNGTWEGRMFGAGHI
jgi:hypothetical protein